jgi:hypothetical protein
MMTIDKLLRILNDNLSSGTLSLCDEIKIVDENNNEFIIKNAECDTQSSDFIIEIEEY